MTDEDLVGLLENVISTAGTYSETRLALERREVLQYYRGELPSTLHKGNSKFVSHDVYDSVDSMRAQLLEAFSAHTNIVQFTPQSADDVKPAEAASEYASYVYFRGNNGPRISYDVLTDGLMSRYGVAKVYVENELGALQSFSDLNEDEVSILESEGFTITSKRGKDGLFSGKGRGKGTKRIVVKSVPLEELLIAPNAPCAEEADIVHRFRKPKSWLIHQGFDPKIVEDIEETEDSLDDDMEKQDRFGPFQGTWHLKGEVRPDIKSVDIFECYVQLDYENSGVEELYRVLKAGKTILEVEKIQRKPFAFFVPLPTPHTPLGENFAKLVIPYQNARTVLIRGVIDHTVITNNPRLQVMNGTVLNPAELLDNRYGGIVNVRRMDGLAPLPQAPLNPYAFQMIQQLDDDKEEATGISRLSQGLNKDAVSKQNSQGLVEQLVSNSQTRQKTVARAFGEFLKALFLLIYDTAIEHMDEEEFRSVSGDWVAVNPATWKARKDVTVELSLGSNERDQQAMKMVQIDQYLAADQRLEGSYGPVQRYEYISRILKKQGVTDVEAIWLPPDKIPPKEPDPSMVLQLEMLKAQIELLKAQAQAAAGKTQNDSIKIANASNIESTKLEMDAVVAAHEMELADKELAAAQRAEDQRGILSP